MVSTHKIFHQRPKERGHPLDMVLKRGGCTKSQRNRKAAKISQKTKKSTEFRLTCYFCACGLIVSCFTPVRTKSKRSFLKPSVTKITRNHQKHHQKTLSKEKKSKTQSNTKQTLTITSKSNKKTPNKTPNRDQEKTLIQKKKNKRNRN